MDLWIHLDRHGLKERNVSPVPISKKYHLDQKSCVFLREIKIYPEKDMAYAILKFHQIMNNQISEHF